MCVEMTLSHSLSFTYHLVKDQQILKIYHLTIHYFFNLTIYAMHNDFQKHLITIYQLIENDILYYDKDLIQTYMSQIF